MNLRGEIKIILSGINTFPDHYPVEEEKLLSLFEKWALKMVGEDRNNHSVSSIDQANAIYYANDTKKEIRDRIKESIK